ncbi:MAG: ribosomal protein S18-alanine N-acetyltransferase [Syntrophorhabdus sp.]|jgi:ribosomal-protein-alanine N-acetyltransferase|nr:ribosomal protein S18-alanine N-acetyltransferase [Syntrophorhabdus sp.]
MAEGGEVTMREMTTGDIDGVLEIERVSFAAPWTRGMFEETLSSPVGMSLVAEQEGRIVGYLVFYFAATEMHVMNIAVKQNRRGLGLASWMMSRVMDLARRNSIETCFLEVRESNVPARGLYEKLGFRQVGRRKGYYRETGEDAIVMELELNDAT